MPIDLLMPQLSPTMTEGRLAKWLKNVGDQIRAGDVVAEVETDKATMEVEASEDGLLHAFVAEAGADLPVGAPIAVLAKKGETVPADYKPTSKAAAKEEVPAEAAPAAAAAQPVAAAAQAAVPVFQPVLPQVNLAPVSAVPSTVNVQPSTGASGRVVASPLAKRMAAKMGVDLSRIPGSGPRGRVMAADLENAPRGGSAVIRRMPDALEKLTPMRKAIAARLTQSKQTVPHFYLKMRADMTSAMELRRQLNAHYEAQGQKVKISVNDLIIKATGLALAKYPAANAAWNGDSVVQFGNVDISVAVSIEGGLITPIVQNADQKALANISSEMKQLAADARANKLKPEQYTGGSFSISNLGMYGVDEFSAIINPPQAAILAVGAADADNMLTLTLSVDHRVIDGALGAEVLGAIRGNLEAPVGLVV